MDFMVINVRKKNMVKKWKTFEWLQEDMNILSDLQHLLGKNIFSLYKDIKNMTMVIHC